MPTALKTNTMLNAESLADLLHISVERALDYLDGRLQPSTREVSVIKGFALASRTEFKAANPPQDNVLLSDTGESMRRQLGDSPRAISQITKAGRGMKALDARTAAKQSRGARPLPKNRKSTTLSTLELCAGGGGAALGLEHAKFNPVALIETDPHACATLRLNRPYWNVIQADIRRFESGYWRGVDLLSGGLPCPPFSIAGKQLGPDDERDLFPAMLRIVKDVAPRAVLIENVRGILTDRFAWYRKRIDAALDKEGFDTHWTGFNASQFGVPQQRFRAFLVALRRGHTKPLKWPIATKATAPTVGEAIGDLMAQREWQGIDNWIRKAAAPAPTIVGGSHKHGGPDLGPTRARREWAQLGVDGLGLAAEAPYGNAKQKTPVRLSRYLGGS